MIRVRYIDAVGRPQVREFPDLRAALSFAKWLLVLEPLREFSEQCETVWRAIK